MKLSLNWVRFINDKYGCSADPAPDGIDRLVEKIGAQLGAVEEVTDLGKKYKGIVVAKVVSCQKHPNADKLRVCLIDPGGIEFDKSNSSAAGGIPQGQPHGTSSKKNSRAGSTGVDDDKFKKYRDKSGLVQVVHGAKNVEAGQLVAWIPPGATVPSTYDREPLVLESRNLRGMISHGMLGSAKELALGDDHEGILVIDQSAKPGQSFAEIYGLDDYIVDIENKMFTHRPDCFGFLGVARELAGIQGMIFRSPKWYLSDKTTSNHKTDSQLMRVKNEVPKLVPRFMMQIVKNVKVEPSSVGLQANLIKVGVRPINNIVDSTNATMLETAQPLHAYDYDKVKTLSGGSSAKIIVRQAKTGEKVKVLGGKEITLEGEEIVIATDKAIVGLGGVIGGSNTEVDENTKNIILECGTFDMNATRRTAMAYGLVTDAATRFTKNQSPYQNDKILSHAISELTNVAGGMEARSIYDSKGDLPKLPAVKVKVEFINERLGLKLSAAQIKRLLENVEFKVHINEEKPTPQNTHFQGAILEIEVPFWRMDIAIAEDIVEEVGRLYGYDHLPQVLPSRNLSAASVNQNLSFQSRLREIMGQAGGNELLTYSFVDSKLLEAAGQKAAEAYHIRNALSPDLQYYRLSLTPSLLAKVHSNIKLDYEQFMLFEVGKAHVKGVNDNEKLPTELSRLSAVLTDDKSTGAAYFQAKHTLEYLLNRIGVRQNSPYAAGKLSIYGTEYSQLEEMKNLPKPWQAAASAFAPQRSALVKNGQVIIGLVGEPHESLSSALKLPSYMAQFELDIEALQNLAGPMVYQPLNRFPSLEQDFCLRSATNYNYAQLEVFMRQQLNAATDKHGISYTISAIDIFQKPNDKQHKQITWRINFWHPQRTLTTEEVNELLDIISKAAKTKLKADRI